MLANDYKFSDEIYLKIIERYLDSESVKDIANSLNISIVKVRKVLITENLWSSKTSLAVQHYLNMGRTTTEIADILAVTEKAIQQYLPYSKGIYKGDNPSVGALNTADFRERVKIAQKRTLRKKIDLAINNEWYDIIKEECMNLLGNDGKQKKTEKFFQGELRILENTDISKFKAPFFLNPVRLHLELIVFDNENADIFSSLNEIDKEVIRESQRRVNVLKEYGNVNYGNSISRDVIVPGEMPLWALNYVIQKCFGWQNSHLHMFSLPEEQFKKITDGKIQKYAELVGVLFRSPWMDVEEEFWNDDYLDGSFNTWLRKKYTGPYESMCHGEGIWQCKQDIKDIKKRYRYAQTLMTKTGKEFYHHIEPVTKGQFDKFKEKLPIEIGDDIMNVHTFEEIPLDAFQFAAEGTINKILERLAIMDVMAIHDKGIDDELISGDFVPQCFDDFMDDDLKKDIQEDQKVDLPYSQPIPRPASDELLYEYDFGDGWKVKITASFGAADLITTGRITQVELDEAVTMLHKNWRPVCIAQDGYPVFDDVGGVSGYVQFLQGINQKEKKGAHKYGDDLWSEDYGLYYDIESSLRWAKSLGWSKRRVSSKNLL